MASAWKNVEPRRVHRERSQPKARAKLGLLEKKKDYKERAQAFHRKKDRLRALQLKAAFRNPDEFNFKMVRTQTKAGRHRQSDALGELTPEMLKLLKSQDLAYVRTKQQADEKKAAKLQSSLHFLGAKRQNTHIVFVDGKEKLQSFDAAKHFDTAPELVDRAFNRPRKATLAEAKVGTTVSRRTAKKARRKRDAAYAELADRTARADKMKRTGDAMQLQKNLTGKGRRQKVKDAANGKPAVFKWAAERKK